jgi:hypothetical protein
MLKPGPDLIDQAVDYWLRKPGLIAWSEIKKDLSERGLSLDRRTLISRVRAGLKRRNN